MITLLVMLFLLMFAFRIAAGLMGLVLRIAIVLSPIALIFYFLRMIGWRHFYY